MNIYKLLMRLFLSLILCVAFLTTALAMEQSVLPCDDDKADGRIVVSGVDVTVNQEEEVKRALNRITDVPLAKSMETPIAEATVTDENGNNTPVEVYTTTREINVPTEARSASDLASKIYAI